MAISPFSARLMARMAELGHSQQDVADWLTERAAARRITGLHATTSQPAVNKMITGQARPHRCKWPVVADYLVVTVHDLAVLLDPAAPFPATRIPGDIGARIKSIRVGQGLDRSDFEALSIQRLGLGGRITAGVLAMVEDGYRTPDPSRIAEIARVLGVDVDDMLDSVPAS